MLHVSNEGEAVQNAEIRVLKVRKHSVEEISTFTMNIPAASASVAGNWAIDLSEDELLIAEIRTTDASDRTFYQKGKLALYPAAVQFVHLPDLHAIEVSADAYIHAVELEGDAVFEDSCFSLLPGETRRIAYNSAENTPVTVTAYTNLP